MRALIVGAGAVGQVYGYHLQRAGWEVGFLVRPRYAEEARAGYTLFPLNRPHRGAPIRFEGFEVYDSDEAAAAQRWDQVWLAVSTPAILADWLPALLDKLGPEVAVVSLQPGPEGTGRVLELVPRERAVFGIIAFIAYQAPLPGEARFRDEGIAYWFPPGPSPFTGPAEPVAAIVDSLKRGGCPATSVSDITAQAGFGSALLQVHIAALEASGWGWSDTRRGPHLALAARAWREAAEIGAAELGYNKPWWTRLVTPLAARLAMIASPWVIPIDLETYLAYHFTKVGDQTRTHLEHWIASGTSRGLPTEALAELRRKMDQGPEHVGAAHAHAARA